MRTQSPNIYKTVGLRHYASQVKMNVSCPSSQLIIGEYKYSQDNLLGKGYSSKVYKGMKITQPYSEYAIKVIQTTKFKQPSIQMLTSEIEIHKSLNHQNIVKCIDVYRTQTHCYIITEYCNGGDLMSMLKQNKRIQEKKVIEIMKQLIQGYKYLLNKGILHRDLKPANIFRSGNTWKIGDFGFSIRQTHEFVDKINVGTPLYMPLQSLMKNRYSCKSDLFALGIIAYEIYCGRTPWECSTEKQLVRKMQQVKIQIPSTIKDQNLREIIKKCCEMNEEKRMQKQQFQKFQFCTHQNPQDYGIKIIKKQPIVTSINYQPPKNIQQKITNSYQNKIKNNNQSTNMYYHSQSTDQDNISKKQISTLTTTPISKSKNQNIFKQNSQILVKQLHYCRLMYYVVKNIEYIFGSQGCKNNLKMLLFKHILKTIKQLQDRKNNHFNLKNWQTYKNDEMYTKLNMEFKEYSLRYERQYLEFLKNVEVNTIRIVNKNFPQVTQQHSQYPKQFYQNFIKFIRNIAKIHNHQLGKLITKNNQKQLNLKSQFTKHIESLQSLITILKINKQIVENHNQNQKENISIAKLNHSIKVVTDYNNSSLKIEDYLCLRLSLIQI